MSWISWYNVLYLCYSIWKWAPGSALHQTWGASIDPNGIPCKLSLFLDNFTTNGAVACNMLVALTVFLVVNMEYKIEESKRMYFAYLGFATIYPIVIAVPAAVGFGQVSTVSGKGCLLVSTAWQYVVRIPALVMLATQLVLISLSLVHMKKIVSSIRSRTGNNFPMGYLVVRFLATFLCQVFTFVPVQIYNMDTNLTNAIYSRFYLTAHMIGPALDATILILGNVEFMNWAKKHIAILRVKFFKARRNSRASPEKGPTAVTIELQETPPTDELLSEGSSPPTTDVSDSV